MEKLLEVVRDPTLTFNERALANRSALQRFEDGKLGMMLGFRDLTPVLREQQNLTFDVMPMPRVGSSATIARMSGMCLSAGSQHTKEAADFLAALISDKNAGILAATGYVMPSNVDVLNSDDFLQTGQRPLHSEVFARELRRAQMLPSTTTWPSVEEATGRVAEPAVLRPGDPPAGRPPEGDRRRVGAAADPAEGVALVVAVGHTLSGLSRPSGSWGPGSPG